MTEGIKKSHSINSNNQKSIGQSTALEIPPRKVPLPPTEYVMLQRYEALGGTPTRSLPSSSSAAQKLEAAGEYSSDGLLTQKRQLPPDSDKYYMDGMLIAKAKSQYKYQIPVHAQQHYQNILMQSPKNGFAAQPRFNTKSAVKSAGAQGVSNNDYNNNQALLLPTPEPAQKKGVFFHSQHHHNLSRDATTGGQDSSTALSELLLEKDPSHLASSVERLSNVNLKVRPRYQKNIQPKSVVIQPNKHLTSPVYSDLHVQKP